MHHKIRIAYLQLEGKKRAPGTAWFQFAREFDCFPRVVYSGCAGWSSLVARRAHNPKVVSSNLTPATNLRFTGREPRIPAFSFVQVMRIGLLSFFRVPQSLQGFWNPIVIAKF